MTVVLRCRALRHAFEVRVADDDTGAQLRDVLAGLASEDEPTSSYELDAGELHFEGVPVVEGTTPGHAVAMLLWHVNQETVRRSSPSQVLLHAAAAARDGVAVVLPAPMEHGKTTTVTGLLRAGFAYVTDEAVAVDPVGLRLEAFPKALSLDRGSWALFPDLAPDRLLTPEQWQVPPARVGAAVQTGLPARLVVAPRYSAGAQTRVEPVGRADMLLTLAQCCFAFTERPRRNLEVLGRLVEGAQCWSLTIGDLDEAVALVSGLVDRVASGRAA